MNAGGSLGGVKGVRCGGIDQLDLHAQMGHVGDVHAPAVAHGANRERQSTAHGGGFNRRKLTVSLPSHQTVLGQHPNVVCAQRPFDGAFNSQRRDEGVVGGPRFGQQDVVARAHGEEFVAVAHHAEDGVLALHRPGSVLEVSAGGVPVGQRADVGGHVNAPPVSGHGGDGVGGQLVEAVRGDDLLRRRSDQTHAGPVCAASVVTHDEGGGAGGVHHRGQPPGRLSHEAVTGGQCRPALR